MLVKKKHKGITHEASRSLLGDLHENIFKFPKITIKPSDSKATYINILMAQQDSFNSILHES